MSVTLPDPRYDRFFDISKVIRAGPGGLKGYERELSDFHRGTELPVAGTPVQLRHLVQRDLTVSGGASSGAATVQSTLSMIVDALRPLSAVLAAGGKLIPDLQGNMVAVRTDLTSTPVWAAENYQETDAAGPTFSQVILKPFRAFQQILVSKELLETASPVGVGLMRF